MFSNGEYQGSEIIKKERLKNDSDSKHKKEYKREYKKDYKNDYKRSSCDNDRDHRSNRDRRRYSRSPDSRRSHKSSSRSYTKRYKNERDCYEDYGYDQVRNLSKHSKDYGKSK